MDRLTADEEDKVEIEVDPVPAEDEMADTPFITAGSTIGASG